MWELVIVVHQIQVFIDYTHIRYYISLVISSNSELGLSLRRWSKEECCLPHPKLYPLFRMYQLFEFFRRRAFEMTSRFTHSPSSRKLVKFQSSWTLLKFQSVLWGHLPPVSKQQLSIRFLQRQTSGQEVTGLMIIPSFKTSLKPSSLQSSQKLDPCE